MRREVPVSPLARALLVGVTLLAAPTLSGCGERGLEARLPTREGVNILIVTFDALRTDRLGAYGSDRRLSPSLDAFAAESVVFDDAYVAGQATPTSFASAFTGFYPHRVFRGWKLEAEVTLAELFAASGYRTGALMHNIQLTRNRHFHRGFEDYRILRGDREVEMTGLALDWMQREDERPFLLWVHFISPHSPYRADPRAKHLYDPDYDGPFQRASRINHTPSDPADRARYRDLYDGEVLLVDCSAR